MRSVKVAVTLERKHPDLAAFVTVPARAVARWKLGGTTTVEGTLDNVPLGRRSLLRWDDERWFIELRREHLQALGKSPGQRATLAIAIASAALPDELQSVIEKSSAASARWRALTDAQRRMLREHVLEAKSPAARERRARRALLPARKPQPPRVQGLPSKPQAVIVRIVGRKLPGTTCGPYREISVGLSQKVGCDPPDGLPADRRQVRWETRVEVLERDGVPAFRGPAVNGPPRERFLYLTWIGRKGRAPRTMFRRAKLRLDAIPPAVLVRALRSGVLCGRLALTADDGMPVCASIRPPAIAWSA